MPGRNTIKNYGTSQYYHVYNRGASKKTIFHSDEDYQYFFYLLKRHLSKKPTRDSYGREYRHLRNAVEVMAYCLMPNHFHLLLYNHEKAGMELLMRSVITAYSMFYNKKYEHSGHVFQGAYKASLITSDGYLQHVCRYIHLNPASYKQYLYSSYAHSINNHEVDWLSNRLFTAIFDGTSRDYEIFVADYKNHAEVMKMLTSTLADR